MSRSPVRSMPREGSGGGPRAPRGWGGGGPRPARAGPPGRGPACLEELREARAAHVPAGLPGGASVEHIVGGSGATIPLRIFLPEHTTVRGVYFEIPGGGFYLGPTAGADARNAALAESLGA